MRKIIGLAFAAVAASASSTALAGTTAGTPFTVQVTVVAGCAINSGPSGTIDFGSVATTSAAPADVASSMSITCTNSSLYTVRFTSTQLVTGNVNRTMVNGAQSVGYQIRTGVTPIGNTAGTGLAATGTGSAQITALNFHINSWAPTTPAVLTDSVTMQVDF